MLLRCCSAASGGNVRCWIQKGLVIKPGLISPGLPSPPCCPTGGQVGGCERRDVPAPPAVHATGGDALVVLRPRTDVRQVIAPGRGPPPNRAGGRWRKKTASRRQCAGAVASASDAEGWPGCLPHLPFHTRCTPAKIPTPMPLRTHLPPVHLCLPPPCV